MPLADKVVWFALAPVAVAVAAILTVDVYEQPLAYLLDAWLLLAIASWIARRPYARWARVWRWVVVVAVVTAIVVRTSL